MYNSATLVPAYGRDYKSKAAVLADWEAGKDFLMTYKLSDGYVNVVQLADLKVMGVTHLHFRYRKLEKVCVLGLK